jgi:hypothetical protein
MSAAATVGLGIRRALARIPELLAGARRFSEE